MHERRNGVYPNNIKQNYIIEGANRAYALNQMNVGEAIKESETLEKYKNHQEQRSNGIPVLDDRLNVVLLFMHALSVYTAPWMVLIIACRHIYNKLRAKVYRFDSKLWKPYLLMFIAVFISDLTDPKLLGLGATFLLLLPYLIYGIYVEEVFSKALALKMLNMLVFLSLPVGIFGIAQKILSDSGIIFSLASGRVISTFYNANLYAAYLVMIILMAIGLIVYYNNDTIDRRLIIIVMINFINLYLTGSRTAMASLAIALIVFFVLTGRCHFAHIAFIITIIYLFIAFIFPQQLIPRYDIIGQDANLRERIFKLAEYGIRKSPIIGRGFLSYWFYARAHGLNEPHAHNFMLNIWFEWGILGLVSTTWLLIEVFKNGLKALYHSQYRSIIAAVLSVVMAALVHGTTDNTIVNIQTGIVFILLISIMMVLIKEEPEANGYDTIRSYN